MPARHFQERVSYSVDKIIYDLDRLIHSIKEVVIRSNTGLTRRIDYAEAEDDIKSLMSMKVFVMRLKSKY